MFEFVTPAEVNLPLSGGHYLTVKAKLNAGETLEVFARMRLATDPDRVDPLQVGPALAIGYLLDWSLALSIRQQPADVVLSALRALEYDDYQEILETIQAHDAKNQAARAEKKTGPAGRTPSDPSSRSLAAVAGATSG